MTRRSLSLSLSREERAAAKRRFLEALARKLDALEFGSLGSEAAAGECLLSEKRAAFASPQNGNQGSPGRMTR